MISIVVPAFNESAVIARTLDAMTSGANRSELDVIVVCNGCTDNTASIARSFGPPVRVIETGVPSKSHALNLGDQAAVCFPRLYVDADVMIGINTIRKLAQRLGRGDVHVVAPTAHIEFSTCSWPVRAYGNIRSFLPSAKEGVGGSGVYALSEIGHRRIREFPNLIADDGYVRIHFAAEERETVASAMSTVFYPATLKHLIATKTRSHYGSFELARAFPGLWKNKGKSNTAALLELFKYPWLWHKLLIYCFVMSIAKVRARRQLYKKIRTWQRDQSSRSAAK